MSERARRIGLNEAVFRTVNEAIEGISERFGISEQGLDLICECGDAGCADRIKMPHSEYVELRADDRTFAVVAGHEIPDVEDVVAQKDGYVIVRKREGVPARVAEETAPS